MALTAGARKLGTHLLFFRDGVAFTAPTNGTCAREAKPGAADTGWIDLGVIKDTKITPGGKDVTEIFAAAPGRLRRWDVVAGKDDASLKFTMQELSAIGIELLFGSLALTSGSTQFNPGEGTPVKGWLKLQAYDQTDTQTVLLDMYCTLQADGDGDFGGENLTEISVEAKKLHSTLNTGTL
jgi:hypothetical protein